jgi:copper chaperone CopZ
MEKTRIIIWLATMLGIGAIALSCKTCINALEENKELRDRVEMLDYTLAHSTVEVKHDTIRDTIPVASQPAVIIDKTDYKKMEADRQLIKDLGLRVAQVEAENRTLLATIGEVNLTPVAGADSDSVFTYHDQWCDFTYLVADTLLKYAVRDSIDTFITREYKHKFLWWRWGTKGYWIYTVNFNPNSKIVYNKYIKVE